MEKRAQAGNKPGEPAAPKEIIGGRARPLAAAVGREYDRKLKSTPFFLSGST